MTINGQSGAGMLDMFTPAAVVRTWSVQCPPGMLAHGQRSKRFTSATAFDGYVHELRARGLTVRFDTPFVAVVEGQA